MLVAFLQASIAGEWRGELRVQDRAGVNLYQFTFKVVGSTLEGTIRRDGVEFPIGDGEIIGNKVRFWQKSMDPSGVWRRSFLFEGEINGDEIVLARSNPGGPATNPNGTPRQPPPPITFKVNRVK